MATLKPGQQLRTVSSKLTVRVKSLLGEGGQGEVYIVELDGQPFALKWYHDVVLRVDRGLYNRLQIAVDRGAPSNRFLWPFELVTLPDGSRLGYLMRLRHPRLQSVNELLHGRIQPSFRTLATTCCLLTDALFALHSKGLAYQDLNAGNIFFDADSGDIEVCDNDNVDVDGAPSVMGGVWEFQAPEVVLRQAGPTRATDLHSLAVMLFRILHLGHPLIGRRELAFANMADESAMRRLYGSQACFVYDPDDDSNRPLPERHGPVIGHWQIYPQFLRELFTRAFVDGLRDPMHGRVQETEWRRAMSQLRDAVMTCPHCGAENFYDPRRLANRQPRFACWSCNQELASAPMRMGIRRMAGRPGEAPAHVLVLEPGVQLYAHHLGGNDYDFGKAMAEVTGTPLGLRNLSPRPWTASRDGESMSIAPGDSVPLAGGWRILFGQTQGEVKT